jgi:hypothetical protein
VQLRQDLVETEPSKDYLHPEVRINSILVLVWQEEGKMR